MKKEVNKAIEELEEALNFLYEEGYFNLDTNVHKYLDGCSQILNKLEEIKKTVKILACDKTDELL